MGRRTFFEAYIPDIDDVSPPDDGSEYISTDGDDDVVLFDSIWVADDAVV